MKATLHIPTEQYGFVAIEVEVNSPQEALEQYAQLTKKTGGLSDIDFRAFIDSMDKGTNHIEVYNQMSPTQQAHIQTIKRLIKRVAYNKE